MALSLSVCLSLTRPVSESFPSLSLLLFFTLYHKTTSIINYISLSFLSLWVIMSKQSYIHESLRQLNDETFYKQLNSTKSKHNYKAINRLVEHIYRNKIINLSEKRFLTSDEHHKQRNFYLLPKIHKTHYSTPNIQPKGRPIVNCKNSESSQSATFIDYFLQPLVENIPPYIRD